jgi:ADP-ribose pyrophosphatase
MKVISSREVFKNKLFTIVDEIAKDPGGFEIHRAIVRHPGSAVMMAVDEEERILLVRQYRLPAEQELWELPAGRIDPGESPLEAAKRELREETGCEAKTWTQLASFWASPGYVDEKMNLFLARDLTSGEQQTMEDERIEIGWFRPDELAGMVEKGEILDAKTLVGYFLWQAHQQREKAATATRS